MHEAGGGEDNPRHLWRFTSTDLTATELQLVGRDNIALWTAVCKNMLTAVSYIGVDCLPRFLFGWAVSFFCAPPF